MCRWLYVGQTYNRQAGRSFFEAAIGPKGSVEMSQEQLSWAVWTSFGNEIVHMIKNNGIVYRAYNKY